MDITCRVKYTNVKNVQILLIFSQHDKCLRYKCKMAGELNPHFWLFIQIKLGMCVGGLKCIEIFSDAQGRAAICIKIYCIIRNIELRSNLKYQCMNLMN